MPNMLRRFARCQSEILPEVRCRLAGGGCFFDSQNRESGQNHDNSAIHNTLA